MGGFKPAEKSECGGRTPGKINASLNEKLKNVEWGEYKIGDLFDSSNGDFDIQKQHINNKGEYVITAGITNNGILGKTDVQAKVFSENTITVDMFGFAFYRPFKYKLVTHARVFSLKPRFNMTENQGLFIASSMYFLNKKFGYENMCSYEKIKADRIKLPIKEGKLNFSFIEAFIAELKAERIAELSAYLKVSGLDNYELSEEEKKAIEKYRNLAFKEYALTEIFDVKNTSNILSRDIIPNSGTTPYLCASSENNAVSTYIEYDDKFLEKGNCIFIGGKTFVVSYQENDFYSNDSHNLALYLKNVKKTKLNQLYLATCVYKSLCHKYSWGDSISKAKIKADKIGLPVKNGKPDYEAMDMLISAIQKLVIKDVVLYADRKIKATKDVIDSHNK